MLFIARLPPSGKRSSRPTAHSAWYLVPVARPRSRSSSLAAIPLAVVWTSLCSRSRLLDWQSDASRISLFDSPLATVLGDTTQRRRQRIRLSRSLIRLSSTWPDFTSCGLSPRNDTVSFSCVRKTPMRGWNGYRYWNITRSIWQLCCIEKTTLKQVKTRHRASTSTRWHFVFGLCCHSNETRAPIVNPPNSAQLGGTRYNFLKLHPGPCSSVEMWRGTDRHIETDIETQTYRRAWLIYILPRLRLTKNVAIHDVVSRLWQTVRPRNSVCNSRPYLRSSAMRPNNINKWSK